MPMSPNDRKAELVRLGVTAAEIARTLGLARAHVSQVLAGSRRSPRVEAEVARVIGKPVERVFGKQGASTAAVA